MKNKISGAEYSFGKMFDGDFDYVIPRYQRPYAWTLDQVSELFDDLYDAYQDKQDTYFLGSIVLVKEEGESYSEVIDGQQRLITLTILLAAITSKLSGDMRPDFEGYIKEPGRPSQGKKQKPRLELRERDRDFFEKYIQNIKFDALINLDSAVLDNEAQRNIQSNSKYLLKELNEKCSTDTDKLFEFGTFLLNNCLLVVVSTPNTESAFKVFNVLNSRGLNLLASDIIKANVIGKIDSNIRDEYTDEWEELEVQIGRQEFNDLLGHIRMIYARKKSKQTLFKEFNTYVMGEAPTSEDLIKKILKPNGDAYLIAKGQKYVSTNNKNAKDINHLLKWLNRIDNSDWLPPAILFLSLKQNDSEYTLWFFTRLERIAAYLHICAKNVNQRIERYAQVIASLQQSHSMNAPPTSVELTKLEIDEMKKALNGNIYELTARRRNYLILRLDSFVSDGAATYDLTRLTVEHVLPQTVSERSEWEKLWPDSDERKKWVHRVANLVPLTRNRNSKAQNYDFDTKKKAYFSGNNNVSSYALTTQIINKNTWTPEVVDQRQKELLRCLIKKWKLEY